MPTDNEPHEIAEAVRMQRLRPRLAQYEHTRFTPGPDTRQAAVAVILRERNRRTDVLFIKRAEKSGDPWSGHMAFPGGHREPTDAGLAAAAVRETLEETGIDLAQDGVYLGAVDEQRASPRGRELDMLIAPHVFLLQREPQVRLNYEVDEIVWNDLGELMGNALHDTEVWHIQGEPMTFNGYRLAGGHFVWGLTYRMLKSFFQHPVTELARTSGSRLGRRAEPIAVVVGYRKACGHAGEGVVFHHLGAEARRENVTHCGDQSGTAGA